MNAPFAHTSLGQVALKSDELTPGVCSSLTQPLNQGFNLLSRVRDLVPNHLQNLAVLLEDTALCPLGKPDFGGKERHWNSRNPNRQATGVGPILKAVLRSAHQCLELFYSFVGSTCEIFHVSPDVKRRCVIPVYVFDRFEDLGPPAEISEFLYTRLRPVYPIHKEGSDSDRRGAAILANLRPCCSDLSDGSEERQERERTRQSREPLSDTDHAALLHRAGCCPKGIENFHRASLPTAFPSVERGGAA